MSELADNPLLAVRDDAGPFHRMARHFVANKAQWIGPAVFSPVALYLLKNSKNTGSYGGGLAGALLASALSKDDHLSTCTAADLPAPIRAQLDPKSKLAKRDVIIIPKSTVRLIKCKSSITVHAGSDTFKMSPTFGFFSKGKNRAMLTSMAWTLDTELTPIAAPVHDMRTEEERVKDRKPLWKRALLIILALGLVAAVIALRIITEH